MDPSDIKTNRRFNGKHNNLNSYMRMDINAHDPGGRVAQVFRVGRVLQREHTDHAILLLLVEVI